MFTERSILLASALVTALALTGCGGSTDAANGGSTNATGDTLVVDATAGGVGAPPTDPANKYTYVDLDTQSVLPLTDLQAASDSSWEIAFKRTSIRINGGISGPGVTTAALADAQEEFYAANGDPNSSVFLNATPESEQPAFDAVVDDQGLSFESDRNIPGIVGDGTAEGWWNYSGPPNHLVTPNTANWWLVRSAEGDSYAKFHVTAIDQANRIIELTLFVQPQGNSLFGTTPLVYSADIGAGMDGARCYDFDAGSEVDCATADGVWDLRVEIAGQNWSIWTSGGVFGSGSGGSFGKISDADIGTFLSAADAPFYRSDATGGLFADNPWYAYNLQGQNKLWPNYRVYVLDNGSAQFKLQVLSYYSGGGTSGVYTLRIEPLAP